MTVYPLKTKTIVQKLRSTGQTFSEINNTLKLKIPKSTLSSWCKNSPLPFIYPAKIAKINQKNLIKARKIAWVINKSKRKDFLQNLNTNNLPTAKTIKSNSVGMIALAMLCLGEASKSKTKHRQFSFGNSDSRIITIFLQLLKRTNEFNPTKIRCTVQCRADQNTTDLEAFWQKITRIPKNQFYPTRTDPRTIGKPTANSNYKGVLVVDYYNRKVQLMLESLADLIYNQLKNKGP